MFTSQSPCSQPQSHGPCHGHTCTCCGHTGTNINVFVVTSTIHWHTGPSLRHRSFSWTQVLLVDIGPSLGHMSFSWTQVLLEDTGPACGHRSLSWTQALLLDTGPSRGHSSFSWTQLLLDTGPSWGHRSCSWRQALLLDTGPSRGHRPFSWTQVLVVDIQVVVLLSQVVVNAVQNKKDPAHTCDIQVHSTEQFWWSSAII